MRPSNIEAAMAALTKRRPVFHSEADFQHELAWTIRERHPDAGIRLEYPLPLANQKGFVDIWFHDGPTAIELKYWTKKASMNVGSEHFALREQAPVWARDEFWRDVVRLESLVAEGLIEAGFAIALTNDQNHWNEPGKPDAIDAAFRLHEGREATGTLDWGEETSRGTKQGSGAPHMLRGRYRLNWRDYSTPASNGALRYLVIDVGAGLSAR